MRHIPILYYLWTGGVKQEWLGFNDGLNFGTIGAMTNMPNHRRPTSRLSSQKRPKESTLSKVRVFFNRADGRIMRFFDEHGRKRQPKCHHHPSVVFTGVETFEQLISIADDYDAKEFFAYRRVIPKNYLRFHYRIVAKVYRTSRDALVWTVIKTHKLVIKVIRS